MSPERAEELLALAQTAIDDAAIAGLSSWTRLSATYDAAVCIVAVLGRSEVPWWVERGDLLEKLLGGVQLDSDTMEDLQVLLGPNRREAYGGAGVKHADVDCALNRVKRMLIEARAQTSMLEDENAGKRWLEENAGGIRAYNARVEHGLFYARQAEEESLASPKEPGAADDLRAVFDAPAQLQSKVKKEDGPEYFDVVIIARSLKTDIWLALEGHLVQKDDGTLVTRILPGHYTVEFGLGSPTYPLHVTTNVRWTEEEITAGPPCARPIPYVPSSDSEP